ncbi:alpha/beta fold hydrolase [Nocardia abscessus]|uniref:alpha/beta fold hydrolase n=2 Tax=Nocardia abscessus TaxID=120957 RepID=UPI0024559CA2|nr:alpha/beta fold hydrolase [Nocardia abscessus]
MTAWNSIIDAAELRPIIDFSVGRDAIPDRRALYPPSPRTRTRMTRTQRPEIGHNANVGGIRTNYLTSGTTGEWVLLVHGSGPGVTAYANWRLVIPEFAAHFQIVAPDMAGFGYSDRPAETHLGPDLWVDQVLGLMDRLNIPTAHLVGNSFGGAIALRVAQRCPDRVGKLVLMGSMGVSFPITPGLERVWGYEPSVENMRAVLDVFAHSRELVTDDLARVRYEASIQPGVQEAFSAMFPAPRQRWIEELALDDDELRLITHHTLIVHGRDDQVIPLANSYRLFELLGNSDLAALGQCGHWSMIERRSDFIRLVRDFLLEP